MKPNGLMLVQKQISQEKTPQKTGKREGGPRHVQGNEKGGKKTTAFRDALEARVLDLNGKKAKIFLKEVLSGTVKTPVQVASKGIGEKVLWPESEGRAEKKERENGPEAEKKIEKKALKDLDFCWTTREPLSVVKNPAERGVVAEFPVSTGESNTGNGERKSRIKGKPSEDGKDAPSVTIVDLRNEKNARETKGLEGRLQRTADGKAAESMKPVEEGDILLLKADSGRQDADGLRTQVRSAVDFSGHLDKLLKNDLGRDIVKQAGIIVKDAGKGEIRLVLQPESLGKVRIRLDLDDNRIAARILVENNSIREVFEQNLEHLTRTFREGGFTADSFEVFVQGDGDRQGDRESREPGHKRLIGELEAMVPLMNEEIREETTVNMVV